MKVHPREAKYWRQINKGDEWNPLAYRLFSWRLASPFWTFPRNAISIQIFSVDIFEKQEKDKHAVCSIVRKLQKRQWRVTIYMNFYRSLYSIETNRSRRQFIQSSLSQRYQRTSREPAYSVYWSTETQSTCLANCYTSLIRPKPWLINDQIVLFWYFQIRRAESCKRKKVLCHAMKKGN